MHLTKSPGKGCTTDGIDEGLAAEVKEKCLPGDKENWQGRLVDLNCTWADVTVSLLTLRITSEFVDMIN